MVVDAFKFVHPDGSGFSPPPKSDPLFCFELGIYCGKSSASRVHRHPLCSVFDPISGTLLSCKQTAAVANFSYRL
jgi:hypothetical protein